MHTRSHLYQSLRALHLRRWASDTQLAAYIIWRYRVQDYLAGTELCRGLRKHGGHILRDPFHGIQETLDWIHCIDMRA